MRSWVLLVMVVGCEAPEIVMPEPDMEAVDMEAADTQDGSRDLDASDVPDASMDVSISPSDMSPSDMPALPMPCASWFPDEETRLDVAFSYGIRCGGCHGAQGQGTYFGPRLWGVVAERGEDEVVRVMQEGEGTMPALGIERSEASSVVVWMRCLSEER